MAEHDTHDTPTLSTPATLKLANIWGTKEKINGTPVYHSNYTKHPEEKYETN
jgi:hypothetical protein